MQAPEKVLAQVAEQILEELAFLYLVPCAAGSAEPAPAPPLVTATVRFEGPFSGALSVTVPDPVLGILAANMLGLEDVTECSREAQWDALGEVANVICNNLLGVLAGGTPVFDLQAPQCCEGAPAETPAPGTVSTRLQLEAGTVDLALVLETDPNAALL
ncbi:MAG: chemotaxis protein CheX [Planctomycetota bacterium]